MADIESFISFTVSSDSEYTLYNFLMFLLGTFYFLETGFSEFRSNILGLCCCIDFSKTYVKQALLSQISLKYKAKSPEMHRFYHKTYASAETNILFLVRKRETDLFRIHRALGMLPIRPI